MWQAKVGAALWELAKLAGIAIYDIAILVAANNLLTNLFEDEDEQDDDTTDNTNSSVNPSLNSLTKFIWNALSIGLNNVNIPTYTSTVVSGAIQSIMKIPDSLAIVIATTLKNGLSVLGLDETARIDMTVINALEILYNSVVSKYNNSYINSVRTRDEIIHALAVEFRCHESVIEHILYNVFTVSTDPIFFSNMINDVLNNTDHYWTKDSRIDAFGRPLIYGRNTLIKYLDERTGVTTFAVAVPSAGYFSADVSSIVSKDTLTQFLRTEIFSNDSGMLVKCVIYDMAVKYAVMFAEHETELREYITKIYKTFRNLDSVE